ncbi:MAG: PAS domain S-box protein [Cyanobacteria bacterium P01_A01_bin.135]
MTTSSQETSFPPGDQASPLALHSGDGVPADSSSAPQMASDPSCGSLQELRQLRQRVVTLEEEKQQLQRAHQTLQEFRGDAEDAPLGCFQLALSGEYLYVNPELARILGHGSPEELLSQGKRHPLFTDDAAQEEFLALLKQQGVVRDLPCCLSDEEGAIHLQNYIGAVYDEAGTIVAYKGYCVDATARCQAEATGRRHTESLEQKVEERTAALRESNDFLIEEIAERQRVLQALKASEAKSKAVLTAIPDLMTIIGRDGVYLEKFHSSTYPDSVSANHVVVGRHIADVLPEEVAQRQIQAVRQVLDEGVGQVFEQELHIGDRVQYEEVRVFPCQEDAALVMLRDITARRNSQDQFQAILETIPGIVSWIGADMRYRGVNLQLAEMFDLAPQDFVGQDIGFLKASSEFADFMRAFFKQSRREAHREFVAMVNGEKRTYLMVVQKYSDGQAAFAVGIDITERRSAEDDLRSTKAQLQAALDAVPGIVSWISADLRYLGVNRHLAGLFNLPPEAFINEDIGFLQTGQDFSDFVQQVFDSPQPYASREISANINGSLSSFLIMAQKYSQDGSPAVFTVGIDITERKQAALKLEEAETRYRSIFESVAEGIFQTTPGGQYLNVNPALARIYGYASTEELMVGLTSIQKQLYVEPNRREDFVEVLEREGEVFKFESQVYRKDGQLIWISENARVVKDEVGQSLYYEGTVEDITERKQAVAALEAAKVELESKVTERTRTLQDLNQRLFEEVSERQRVERALRSSEAELRALFAAMTDYIAVFDASGHYRKIVSTGSELLYGPELERVGKSVYDVLPHDAAARFIINIQRALNTGQTLTFEYSLPVNNQDACPHDNQEAWFSATVSPMPDNCVIWVARDITQQRLAQQALREAEEKYRSIFENAAEGIFQTTPAGQYLSVNPALVNMYGYDSESDLLDNLSSVDQLYIDVNRRSEFVAKVEADNTVVNFEAQVRRGDGEVIWTTENARAVRDPVGEILYYEGTVQDITERKRAEIALIEEQNKSEQLLLSILPRPIANDLKMGKAGQAIAERFDAATILFADIVDFTSVAARKAPSDVVKLLNDIFSSFDRLADLHGLEKIKTIGDAYMVAGGIPTRSEDHVGAIAEMALDMQREITRFSRTADSLSDSSRTSYEPFQLRIGIHTGPAVAGVIGIRKFIYDLWGDTVNIASRMESQGEAGAIQVTEDVCAALEGRYRLEQRGIVNVKGKGEMTTYWLKGRCVLDPHQDAPQ